MTTKKETLPDYWSVYWAINKQRVKGTRKFTDKKSGEEMNYEFIGAEHMQKSIFLQLFSSLLWMAPVFLIIVISALYLRVCPYSLFLAIAGIVAYHFAAMYYIIRGPHIAFSSAKKKGLFSRK